jgi:uncharacterized protein (TIGR02246 family)
MIITPEDYVALVTLYATQSQAIDNGDGEGFASTFTPDAVFAYSKFQSSGTDELIALARKSYASSEAAQNRHWPGNFKFARVSDTEIHAVYYSLVLSTDEDMTPKPKRMSVISDTLRKVDGQWRVAHRRAVADPLGRRMTGSLGR